MKEAIPVKNTLRSKDSNSSIDRRRFLISAGALSGLALMEALALYALVIAFFLQGKV